MSTALTSLAAFLRRFKPRRLVRTWALCAPMLVLAISIPLLQPLRNPDPNLLNDDVQANFATVQAIVEQQTLAINQTRFRGTRSKIVRAGDGSEHPRYYSNQPPMLAVLASAPYWALHRMGLAFGHQANLINFLLTLLTVTIPVAMSAGLVYRMGRIFELTRPRRAALAAAVVFASGLISYSTVFNAHAPAAALLLAAAAGLIHVITHRSARVSLAWLALAGFCAALAAALDPPALAFLLAFVLVIASFRWPLALRIGGIITYAIAAAIPISIHAKLTFPLTGDLRAGLFHPELGAGALSSGRTANPPPQPNGASETPSTLPTTFPFDSSRDEEDEPQTGWGSFFAGCRHVLGAFIGRHGIFTHFPVALLGIIGVTLIMHRHWPTPTKMLAGAILGAALAVILAHSLFRSHTARPMFATRWFVVIIPPTLFWAGAWLRRGHRQSSWIMAGTLLAFSVIVSLIGATGPLPRDGYDYYSVTGAWHRLIHRAPHPTAVPSNAAGSENEVKDER